jgi:hypothetical protein
MSSSRPSSRPAGRACALVALLSLSGCAEILDIPDNATLALQGPWRCLGHPEPAPIPSQGSATVRVEACDFISNCLQPVTGLTARLCAKRDVACTNPIRTDIRDVGGVLELAVPTAQGGFDGYLEISAPPAPCTDRARFGAAASGLLCSLVPECDPSAPDERCDIPSYARSLLFFNPPVTGDLAQPLRVPMLSSGGLPAVVQAAGATLDPTTGNLFITALDCDGTPTAGVTYAISQHQDVVTQLYVDNGVVSDTALRTDQSGIGGFVGVPAGFVEVTAFKEDFEPIGDIGVLAAPFTMTYCALVPTR